MAHTWPQGVTLDYHRPDELAEIGGHPELVDPDLLLYVDELRGRLGFPFTFTSAVRTEADLIRIYGSLSAASDSPHQVRDDGWGHALDVQPYGDLGFREFHHRKAEIWVVAYQMGPYREGTWERQGLEMGTRHVHLDNDTKLNRPYYWGGKSR